MGVPALMGMIAAPAVAKGITKVAVTAVNQDNRFNQRSLND